MKKAILTLVLLLVAFSGVRAQYGFYDYYSYSSSRNYAAKIDDAIDRQQWDLAASNAMEMIDSDEDAAWEYLYGIYDMDFHHALAGRIAADPRRITQSKMIYALSVYDTEKNYGDILDFCESVSNYFGYNDYLNYFKAKGYYGLGLKNEATESFARLLQINPNALNAEGTFLVGKMHYVTGDPESGFLYMAAAVDSCHSVNAYLDFAMVCYLQHQYDVAISYLNEVVRLEKENRYFTYLGRDDVDKKAMAYFIKALCQHKGGFLPNVEATYRQLLTMENHYDTCLFSNIALRSLGHDVLADSCLEQLLRSPHLSAAGHYAAAYGLAIAGRDKEALRQATLCLGAAADPLWQHFFTDDPTFDDIRSGVKSYAKKQSKAMAKRYPEKKYTRRTVTLPFFWNAGIMVVSCHVNGIPTFLYFDSGASEVQISSAEKDRMVEEGVLTDDDILGTLTTLTADGTQNDDTSVILKSIRLGDNFFLTDVRATVSDSPNSMLLLGQSVLSRFEKVEIDYENFTITLTYRQIEG